MTFAPSPNQFAETMAANVAGVIYTSISVCTIFLTILHTFTFCSLSTQHWQLPSSMGHFQLWVYMRLWSHSKCLHQMPDWMLEELKSSTSLLSPATKSHFWPPYTLTATAPCLPIYFVETLWIYFVYLSLLCSSGTSVLHYSHWVQETMFWTKTM